MNNDMLFKMNKVSKESIIQKWCVVDVNNKFNFIDILFIIDESLKEYVVYRKASDIDDFTNESYMDSVLATIDKEYNIKFYNQNYEEITNNCYFMKGKDEYEY